MATFYFITHIYVHRHHCPQWPTEQDIIQLKHTRGQHLLDTRNSNSPIPEELHTAKREASSDGELQWWSPLLWIIWLKRNNCYVTMNNLLQKQLNIIINYPLLTRAYAHNHHSPKKDPSFCTTFRTHRSDAQRQSKETVQSRDDDYKTRIHEPGRELIWSMAWVGNCRNTNLYSYDNNCKYKLICIKFLEIFNILEWRHL